MSAAGPVDAMLAAAAATFRERAEASRERAELAREGLRSRDSFHSRSSANRVRQHLDHAAVWESRAREAGRGRLLLTDSETNDGEFMREFSDLIISAEAAGRVRYVRSMLG